MASIESRSLPSEQTGDEELLGESSQRDESGPRRAMGPPRFTLRGVLILFAVTGALMAASRELGPRGQFVLFMATSSILLHVASTAIGSHLRASSDRATFQQRQDQPPSAALRRPAVEFAPQTHLAHRRPLPASTLWLTLASGLAGASWGGISLASHHWQTATVSSVGVGAAACGILGLLLGFGGSSLWLVFRSAWREAAQPTPAASRASVESPDSVFSRAASPHHFPSNWAKTSSGGSAVGAQESHPLESPVADGEPPNS